MLNIFVGEYSFIVENVIDENVVALLGRLRFVVVVVLQDLATLVNDSLMKASQEVRLSLILFVPRS